MRRVGVKQQGIVSSFDWRCKGDDFELGVCRLMTISVKQKTTFPPNDRHNGVFVQGACGRDSLTLIMESKEAHPE